MLSKSFLPTPSGGGPCSLTVSSLIYTCDFFAFSDSDIVTHVSAQEFPCFFFFFFLNVDHFKVFIEFVTILLLSYVLSFFFCFCFLCFFGPEACGIIVP